jgi:SAM-dependent methyltransferase
LVAWYEESFGQDYLIVYRHRDVQGAYREVRRMIDWLHLPHGAEVLDLCCGMGRHSLALSDCGYRVTGVDLSDVLLAEAKKLDQKSRVTWVKGDMRNVPLDRPFDAVVNLFTSFGYFDDDAENARVLSEIDRLLRPGGKFIIDYLNPQHVEKHLAQRTERREGRLRIEEVRDIADGFVRKRIAIHEEGRPARHYTEQVKMYRLEQFERMMQPTRLRIDRVYGNYDGQPFEPDASLRMIMVGHKTGDSEKNGDAEREGGEP